MAYENLCMYCFEALEGKPVCPHCGRDSRTAVPQIQMLPGSLVYHDRFLIGRALGQDASGIVYAAYDTKRESKLRIREYLPRDCAERLNDGAVVPVAGREDEFESGIRKLRASVESVEDPRKRHFFFEENGTAYIAQRKSAAAAAEADEEPEEETGGGRRIILFVGIAVAVLVVAAIALISLFNGALNTNRDIAQSATLDPNQVWIPAESPTATPYVAPTFAALVDPDLSWMDYTYDGDVEADYQRAQRATATPKPAVTGDTSDYNIVNGKSSQTDVRAVQEKLAALGWLSRSAITGKYDDATRQAVRDFQNYVNEHYDPGQKLSVDGIAGPKTLQWLYETNAVRPTPTPTPKVTAEPGASLTVDENARAADVKAVQQKLITLGLMPEGSADGQYGASTAAAVRRFQTRVNQLQGYDALEITGKMDPQSLAFLNYYAREWERLRKATAEPTATPTPSPAPTATPQPVPTPQSGVIDGNASKEAVRGVQRLLIGLGMLPADSDDGIYGSATISAVASFQQWVNVKRDEATLKVNGEVDELTLAYLQYCLEHNLKPYATSKPTQSATAAPTQAPTEIPAEPDEPNEDSEISVDADSDPDSIRYVQQMLNSVGLMKESAVDGVYGKGTTEAVRRFQEWVNRTRGEDMLPVTGQVDNQTRQALEYASDHELKYEAPAQPTEVPTRVPTEAPTEAPTQEPTQAPTEAPTEVPAEPDEPNEDVKIIVNADSDPDSIRYVQQMLRDVGLMSSGGIDGVYGKGTTEAVRRFQQWVNEVQGSQVLAVTGQIDDLTRRALEYAADHGMKYEAPETPTEAPTQTPTEVPTQVPTEAPTQAPTEVPAEPDEPNEDEEISVDADSDPDSIRYVQQMLRDVGLMSADGVDGVYGKGTTEAVRRFQQWVNEVQGSQVLAVTGQIDDRTRRALEYAADHGMKYEAPETPTEAPTEAPEPPTEAPTQAPTEAPKVAAVNSVDIAIGDAIAGGDVVTVSDGQFAVRWRADGEVAGYYVYVEDSSGRSIIAREAISDTSFNVNTSQMQPGEVYTVRVGALPVNGGENDMVWRTARFTTPVKATPEPEPTVGAVSAPSINIAGVTAGSSTIMIEQDSFQISWSADGAVQSYYVRITDSDGREIVEPQNTTHTGLSVKASAMQPGVTYTIAVGVLPVNGTQDDVLVSRAQFMLPQITPEPTAEPTEVPTPDPTEAPTPAPTAASVGKPVINVGGSTYQQDGIPYVTDNSIIVSWNADGDVDSYTVYVENQAGERHNLGTTRDTSRTVNAQSLPAGLYTVYVGAKPVNGSDDDMQWNSYRFGIPAPTPEPTEVPTQAPTPEPPPATEAPSPVVSIDGPITGSSDADTIQQLQMRLYSLGLLSTDGLEPGVLDQKTLQAVADFQTRMNEERGAGLVVLDPSDPTSAVDAATVRALFGN